MPATCWWIVDEAAPGEVLGSIHLRHELNDWLLAEGGHIGYGVRPSARGRERCAESVSPAGWTPGSGLQPRTRSRVRYA